MRSNPVVGTRSARLFYHFVLRDDKTAKVIPCMFLKYLFALIFIAPTFRSSEAAEIAVAAAADLKFALDELRAEFQKKHPEHKVNITYGSSGNFYAQLQSKAPFDIYFSADIEYPRQLVKAGQGAAGDLFQYAIGRLAVWAPNTFPAKPDSLGIQTLFAPSVKKIAIANPKHAPYGKAAVAALKSLKVYEQAEPKLVYGENIAQAAQFVQSGAADVGIIALSLAISPQMRGDGKYWEVPPASYPPLEQGGLILNWAKDRTAARAFCDFVLGESGRVVLKRYGFFMPDTQADTPEKQEK